MFSCPVAAVAAVASAVAVALSGAEAVAQVTITAEGTVEESCALSLDDPGQLDLGVLTTLGPRVIEVTVSCNSPWTYSLASSKGALEPDSAPPVAGGSGAFASAVPYTITTVFETEGGSFGDANLDSGALPDAAACVANAASGCPFANSGTDVSIDRPGTVTLNWTASSQPLLAATYTDTLTLTVLVL